MSVAMSDSQFAILKPNFVDKKSNPAAVDGVPEWSTDNTDVLALRVGTLNDDGTFTDDPNGKQCRVDAVGPLGTATVTMKADADLGDGVVPIVGTVEFTINAGQATTVTIDNTAPAEQ